MMAAMVQSFPSPTSTMTMLQSRPPQPEAFQAGSQGQQHQKQSSMSRNTYNTPLGGMAGGNYRGQIITPHTSSYAYPATSVLHNGANPLRQHPTSMPHPRLENRTASAPSIPVLQQVSNQVAASSNRPRPPISNFVTTPLNGNSGPPQNSSRDDSSISALPSQYANSRPLSTIELNPSPNTQMASYANVAKSSPDRYRRNNRRAETSGTLTSVKPMQGGSAMPSGSGMATVGHLYTHPNQTSSTPTLSTYPSYRGTQVTTLQPGHDYVSQAPPRQTSQDDMTLQQQNSSELAKRYRRRSISSLEAKEFAVSPEVPAQAPAPQKTYAAMLAGPAPHERKEVQRTPTYDRPNSSHGRAGSNESSSSGPNSRPASVKRGAENMTPSSTIQHAVQIPSNEAKTVNVPARGSSDTAKRFTNPSPLSKPISMNSEAPMGPETVPAPSQGRTASPVPVQPPATQAGLSESPAAQHLAALNKKEGKKDGKPSRLRRAFSFGSTAELRKVSAENTANNNATTERAKLRKDRYQDEKEAQEAAKIQQQEASGLGEGIYSGQGQFFTGSTDNLSISSTASSASVMIRKMGKGMKKGSRSLVGLFRPKSVVGVPAADGPVEPSMAQVSMVTVEAEREKVNVNPNPHDQVGGGTGFPKLERNSMDAAHMSPEMHQAFNERESTPRRSIVGGEKERAEVLAAVKKGILKRTGTGSGSSSPVPRPVDSRASEFNIPQIPRFNESPHSSAPSTPLDENTARNWHGRTDSVHIEGEDYFLSLQNFASGDSRSMPGTPKSIARNITFSPRIRFHDTWPSGEYDRRGEIATCNRLTPMLAQQIKEELNTFKMEMEVHNESKINTHFF